MLYKKRIRLSRNLHAQTTPYPRIGKLLRSLLLLIILGLGIGIIVTGRNSAPTRNQEETHPKQILGEQETAPPPQYEAYTVARGDTLFNISGRYNISWQILAEINDLQEPYTLRIGQQLKIPR